MKQTTTSSGKQSVGHDVLSFDVNEAFQGERPSLIIGERKASSEYTVAAQTQEAFSKASGFQVRMSNEFVGMHIWR